MQDEQTRRRERRIMHVAMESEVVAHLIDVNLAPSLGSGEVGACPDHRYPFRSADEIHHVIANNRDDLELRGKLRQNVEAVVRDATFLRRERAPPRDAEAGFLRHLDSASDHGIVLRPVKAGIDRFHERSHIVRPGLRCTRRRQIVRDARMEKAGLDLGETSCLEEEGQQIRGQRAYVARI